MIDLSFRFITFLRCVVTTFTRSWNKYIILVNHYHNLKISLFWFSIIIESSKIHFPNGWTSYEVCILRCSYVLDECYTAFSSHHFLLLEMHVTSCKYINSFSRLVLLISDINHTKAMLDLAKRPWDVCLLYYLQTVSVSISSMMQNLNCTVSLSCGKNMY